MSEEIRTDFRNFLCSIVGETAMHMIDDCVKGNGNALVLAAHVDASAMNLVDGYVNAVRG